MVAFPHAKINLGLQIIFKRSDGYHNIETCFYPIPITDVLEVIPSREFSFAQTGLKISGNVDDNLCMKAYKLLKKDFSFGEAKIHLHKIIPMGAGLGGGSSDGAFTLKLLNQVFDLKISKEKLRDYASQLGSDCSFFLEDTSMIGTGRGEILEPVSIKLQNYFLILVKPNVHVSTAEAYSGINPIAGRNSVEETIKVPLKEWKNNLVNDFEKTIFKKYPIIEQVKEKFHSCGALYASMSGSGASVFGIFERPTDLQKEFSGMFYWSGELK